LYGNIDEKPQQASVFAGFCKKDFTQEPHLC